MLIKTKSDMKKFKITVFLTLSLALAGTGSAWAQDERRDAAREERAQEWADRMTDRMAEAYGLDEGQKKELLEANEAFVKQMGDMPRPDYGRRGHHRRRPAAGCCCGAADYCCDNHRDVRPRRHHLTPEEREARAAEWKKNMEDRKAAFQAYDANLQKIMTKEQYEAYKEKRAERWERMRKWREDRK